MRLILTCHVVVHRHHVMAILKMPNFQNIKYLGIRILQIYNAYKYQYLKTLLITTNIASNSGDAISGDSQHTCWLLPQLLVISICVTFTISIDQVINPMARNKHRTTPISVTAVAANTRKKKDRIFSLVVLPLNGARVYLILSSVF